MKKVTLFLFVSLFAINIGCAQTPEDRENAKSSEITFEKTEHDFGQIPHQGDGTCEFVFKNTGKEALILSNVRASCGCTIPEWTKEPIKKGKSSVIKVKYDTKRIGTFSKSITVYSNAKDSPIILKIKGTVNAATPTE